MKCIVRAALLASSIAGVARAANCYDECPSNVSSSGCESSDWGCLCQSAPFIDTYNSCVYQSCPNDKNSQDVAFLALVQLCGIVAVPITASPEVSVQSTSTLGGYGYSPTLNQSITAITNPLQGPPHHSTLSTIPTGPGPACVSPGLFSACENATTTPALSTTFTNPISTISGNSTPPGTSTVLSTATATVSPPISPGSTLGPSTNPGGPMSSATGGGPSGSGGASGSSTSGTPSTQSGGNHPNLQSIAVFSSVLAALTGALCL